jgi:hypothetical protein
MLFLASAPAADNAEAVASHSLTARPDAPPFAEVVRVVAQKGWTANLGRMCVELGLATAPSGCLFRQISVQETEGRGDPHAVNVPLEASEPYALVFHLGPLAGEFFVVTPDGSLKAAYIRTKGSGYSRLPDSEAEPSFRSDLAYWRNNLERIGRGLETPAAPPR